VSKVAGQDDTLRLRDELVEALYAGDFARAGELGQLVVDARMKASGEPALDNVRASGTLLRPDQIPTAFEDLYLLDATLRPERLRALEHGADLTPDELALGQELWVRNMFGEDPDCDVYAVWTVHETRHRRDGRRVYTAEVGTGYSFTEVRVSFVGASATFDGALDALRQRGYIDLDDYEARHPRASRPSEPRN
jgi:hypothetical protein